MTWDWKLSREQMEAVWNKPGVEDPLGRHAPRPSKELAAKIRRECPHNAESLIAAHGKVRTKFDAPYAPCTRPQELAPIKQKEMKVIR